MPAEWGAHRATWIAWPHNKADWPGKLAPIAWVYGEIVRHLARSEVVAILVRDAAMARTVRRLLERVGADLARVEIHPVATDRSWTRDTGPIFVRRDDGAKAAVIFRFNAWAKYPDHKRDAKVAARIAELAGVARWSPVTESGERFVLEGGAIDVDGDGTLLATEECLLDRIQERNPGVSRDAQEKILSDALGITRVIWLGRGIAGDDTHGHVDDLARFVGPGKVLLAQESDGADENHRVLAENRERLQGARDARGRKLEVIPLPMPCPLRFEGRRLPASYANFYIGQRVVLVPTFNDARDRFALGILSELFPGREVVGIHAVDLVWGLGTLHCLTQQEPA
jgi:agmatine deiminase